MRDARATEAELLLAAADRELRQLVQTSQVDAELARLRKELEPAGSEKALGP